MNQEGLVMDTYGRLGKPKLGASAQLNQSLGYYEGPSTAPGNGKPTPAIPAEMERLAAAVERHERVLAQMFERLSAGGLIDTAPDVASPDVAATNAVPRCGLAVAIADRTSQIERMTGAVSDGLLRLQA